MQSDRRIAILKKYNSHCGYCGCEINLKSMQVDHIVPKRIGGTDDIDNLMPSCRLCNHYKRGGGIEYLRNLLSTMQHKLESIYIFRVAQKYGMICWSGWDGIFYFEKEKK